MTDKRVITDDAGQELTDLQLRVPADESYLSSVEIGRIAVYVLYGIM